MKLPKDFINWVLANPKLVDRKATSNPDLFVLKYKRKVFYDGLWNRFLEDCRGTIVDKEWNIVSLPFRKVYNFGIEKEAPKLSDDTVVRAFRKVNGFMVAATIFNGELLISTTGSIDSGFADIARQHFADDSFTRTETMLSLIAEDITMLFECCDPTDPHIITEPSGLHPIGYRYNDLTKGMAHMWDYPGGFNLTLGDLKDEVKLCTHEGYVFYTKEGVSAKIKSPHYLVKKLFMRGRDMATLLQRNAKEKIDEEYYPLLDYLSANRDHFDALDEQGRRVYIEEFLNKENHAD